MSRAGRSRLTFVAMSLALKVLIALVAGLALGLGIASSGSPALSSLVPVIEPVGTLWVSAIRMTIIPLVVSSLIVGIGGAADPRTIGRLGLRTLIVFVTMVAVATVISLIAGPPLVGMIHIDPASAEAMRVAAGRSAGAAVEGAKTLPGVAQWLVDLVPANPVKAAADGAMLPLILFSLVFGAALSRVEADRRTDFLRVIGGVQDASLVLVRAIIALAPIGVFALGVSVAAKLGVSAAGAIATYIAVVSGLNIAFCAAVLYPTAVILGGVSLRSFARAAVPAQAVAFSSRSALATLPARAAFGSRVRGARVRVAGCAFVVSFSARGDAAPMRRRDRASDRRAVRGEAVRRGDRAGAADGDRRDDSRDDLFDSGDSGRVDHHDGAGAALGWIAGRRSRNFAGSGHDSGHVSDGY